MFRDFYTAAQELHEAIKQIRNVWIPRKSTLYVEGQGVKYEYKITDTDVMYIRLRIISEEA